MVWKGAVEVDVRVLNAVAVFGGRLFANRFILPESAQVARFRGGGHTGIEVDGGTVVGVSGDGVYFLVE